MTVSAVILTYNEEIHLARCLNTLRECTTDVHVIDSFSTDLTVKIANNFGASVYFNKWINYSCQFNWALKNCNINSDWILRIDADEYLDKDTIDFLKRLNDGQEESNFNSFYLKRRIVFLGKKLKKDCAGSGYMLRLWRNGLGKCEERWMDEHIIVENEISKVAAGEIIDHNLNNIDWWLKKHINYATREAIDQLNPVYHFFSNENNLNKTNKNIRVLKNIYNMMPRGIRCFLYFIYRYLFRLGFLDGWQGFVWHSMQGYWYRLLVDVKVSEIKNNTNDKSEVVSYIKENYGIEVDKQ